MIFTAVCSAPVLPLQESGLVVDERQVAQVMTMLANNYNSVKGQGDDGDLSSALTSSLFSSGEGQVRRRGGEDREKGPVEADGLM